MMFWDAENVAPLIDSWMAPAACRAYINKQVSGDPNIWPIEWLRSLSDEPFSRALSIGCGSGPLERSLIDQCLCHRIEAIDASVPSLALARQEASRAGYGGSIHYFAADFNRISLPLNRYDAVFFHQSLHHVAYLERLFLQVWRTLRPGGMLYLDEYVGPSRFEWNDQRIQVARTIYRQLPRDIRRFEELPLPIIPGDPSEAVRSSDIVRYLRLGFSVVHERPYGGAVLAPIY
jgi:SAM-dependent methyltransferase